MNFIADQRTEIPGKRKSRWDKLKGTRFERVLLLVGIPLATLGAAEYTREKANEAIDARDMEEMLYKTSYEVNPRINNLETPWDPRENVETENAIHNLDFTQEFKKTGLELDSFYMCSSVDKNGQKIIDGWSYELLNGNVVPVGSKELRKEIIYDWGVPPSQMIMTRAIILDSTFVRPSTMAGPSQYLIPRIPGEYSFPPVFQDKEQEYWKQRLDDDVELSLSVIQKLELTEQPPETQEMVKKALGDIFVRQTAYDIEYVSVGANMSQFTTQPEIRDSLKADKIKKLETARDRLIKAYEELYQIEPDDNDLRILKENNITAIAGKDVAFFGIAKKLSIATGYDTDFWTNEYNQRLEPLPVEEPTDAVAQL
ncbi:MAG: hypothetical protein WC752_01915 [Patescibacteria group bacterium]|jgi:hypothetical protein